MDKQKSIHHLLCTPASHGNYPHGIEACYYCEELVTCFEAYITGDYEYPVYCFNCMRENDEKGTQP